MFFYETFPILNYLSFYVLLELYRMHENEKKGERFNIYILIYLIFDNQSKTSCARHNPSKTWLLFLFALSLFHKHLRHERNSIGRR